MSDQDRPGFEPPAHHVLPEATASPHQAPADVIASGPRRSRVGVGVAIAAIAIGGIGVAGTAYASSSSPAPGPSAGSHGYGQGVPGTGYGNPPADGDRGHGPGGMGMRGGMRMGLGMGIHGSFVTPKPGGGYQTIATQQGSVTAVTATSITVKSEDGFTATYVVNASTIVKAKSAGIAAVKVGDSVAVTAVQASGTDTAVTIIDRTQVAGSAKSWAPPRPAASAAPSGSASGTA